MHTYDCTFHGLHKWHTALFEKLGWMIMAKEYKSDLKIKSYMECIQNFLSCVQKKITDTRDEDRKDDLAILMKNVKCLEDCAHKLMKIPSGEYDHKYNHSKPGHKATNCGLQKWMVAKYEKLGWMCLAKQHGDMLKIEAYIDSLRSLMSSLEMKIREVDEKDRKDDLEITLNNTKMLKHNAWMLLLGEKCTKSMKSSSMKSKSMLSKSMKSNSMKSNSMKSKSIPSSSRSSRSSRSSKKTKKTPSSWF